MNAITTIAACDQCGKTGYSDDNPRVFMCQPRPSCRSEMCCTLAGHKDCFRIVVPLPSISEAGGIATADQWNEWIESDEARNAAFLWLSL